MIPANGKRWAMVLAAGLGTRLKHITRDKPKALVEVLGKPLLQHVLENLKRNGFTDVVINIHHFAGMIIDFTCQNDFGLNIYFSDEQNQLMDTGGAILQALKLFPRNEVVMVHNVDLIHNYNLHELRENFIVSEADAALVVSERASSRKLVFDTSRQLIAWTNESTGSVKLVNNKVLMGAADRFSFDGIHFFYPEIFSPFEVKPSSVIDIYLELAANKRVLALPYNRGWWYDLGKADSIPWIENELMRLKYL